MNTEPQSSQTPPVGTVTVLLTDVEASTRLWESDPDGAKTVTARMDEIASDVVDAAGGHRPVEQGEGDSLVAAFPSPIAAVSCAAEFQRALHGEPWPPGIDVRVRMAVHTGELELRDRRYIGHALNRCARLRDLAHGGQVLVSGTTSDLVSDGLSDGIVLRHLGPHRLRDLTRPERVYQLCHPDLPDDFPPLRSLTALPNNLPVQLTSFIGRGSEMADLERLLARTRILTLTGSGGCGKTRLALEVGAAILDRYPHGVWWVDLAPISDASLIPNAVAAAAGVHEVGTEAMEDTLTRWLGDGMALVVLDNCEHLLDGCVELITSLIARCPGLSIVATSREPLGLDGETTFRVPSLRLPEGDDDIAGAESVRLFCERAQGVRPGFELTEPDAVSRICRRLDGIPLAIELAAARVRMLSPEQIADGLADRFHLLTGGARTSLPRQRTLEASVDWSYRLLTESQRTLLARLSVFAGSFGLEAAEDVCSDDSIDRYEVLDLLSALVDRSLVQVEEGGREARYRLLETIRVYARQKLADAGDAVAVRNRHLDHFVAMAERAEANLQSTGFEVWLDRLDNDLDNLRAALDWALTSGRVDDNLRIVGAAGLYWMVRSRYVEMQQRFEAGLATEGADPLVRAKALIGAYAVWFTRDFHRSNALAAEAVELLRKSAEDHPLLAAALVILGWTEYWLGQDGWREPMEEGVARARSIGHPFLLARCVTQLGMAEAMATRPSAGRPLLEEAVTLLDVSAKFYLAPTLTFLGLSAVLAGYLEDAHDIFRRATEHGHAFGHGMFTALPLSGLGIVALMRGDLERARELFGDARRVAMDSGAVVAHRQDEMYLGAVTLVAGDVPAAVRTLAASLDANRKTGIALGVADNLTWLGLAQRRLGDLEEAEDSLTEAVKVAHAYPSRRGQALVELARLSLDRADPEAAEETAHEALTVLVGAEDKVNTCDALEVLAAVAAEFESHREAVRIYAAAQRLRDEIGYVRFPVDVEPHETTLEELRVTDDFEAAWSKGAALSLDEAVAYARRGRGERKRPSAGWASLTPRELEVVGLVAQGLTNPQVAERLFVTRDTVKVHLSHVFGKLGVSTRSELAALATERGLRT